MRSVATACVLASAAAFLGMRAPLPVKTPRVVKAPAVAMSSALAEESGVSLSSGGGMFTSSSPEDRRIGTELLVSGVRYRERRYPEVKSAHRAPELRGSVGGVDRGPARRLGGARRTAHHIFCRLPPLSWREQKISNSTQRRRARATHM